MNTYSLAQTDLVVSRIAYGCMNLGQVDSSERVRHVLGAALEQGITLFDHADIYAGGRSETVFGAVLNSTPGLRDTLVLQSKCGIRFQGQPDLSSPQRYDFSYEHIIASVNGSLQRLQTDRLDLLLLHRPDPLMEGEEVARAFDELHGQGKVRYFGVSNHSASQMALLREYVRQPLVVNQLELSLLHAQLIDAGLRVNQGAPEPGLAGGLLDDCRLHAVRVQAWGPLANGRLFRQNRDDRLRPVAEMVQTLAAARAVSPEAILLAWLLRHPAGLQPVIGTTQSDRMAAACQADAVTLSREEWYRLFAAARGAPVP